MSSAAAYKGATLAALDYGKLVDALRLSAKEPPGLASRIGARLLQVCVCRCVGGGVGVREGLGLVPDVHCHECGHNNKAGSYLQNFNNRKRGDTRGNIRKYTVWVPLGS